MLILQHETRSGLSFSQHATSVPPLRSRPSLVPDRMPLPRDLCPRSPEDGTIRAQIVSVSRSGEEVEQVEDRLDPRDFVGA